MRRFASGLTVLALFLLMLTPSTRAGEAPKIAAALIHTKSAHGFAETLSKVKAAIDKRGLKTFAVIDHSEGAASVGEELSPTTVIIFGNPKAGTPLMQSSQSMGIFLPLRALVYEKADGSVSVATHDVRKAAKAYGVTGKDKLLSKIEGTLAAIAKEATR